MKDSPDISTSSPLKPFSDGGRRIFDTSQPAAIRERIVRDSTVAQPPSSETTFDPEKLTREFEADIRKAVATAEQVAEKFKPEKRFWLESPSQADQIQEIYERVKRIEMKDQCEACVRQHLASKKYPPESLLLIAEHLSPDARSAVEQNKRLFGFELGRILPSLLFAAEDMDALKTVASRLQAVPDGVVDPDELRHLRSMMQFNAIRLMVEGQVRRIEALESFDIEKALSDLAQSGLLEESPMSILSSWRGKDTFISTALSAAIRRVVESSSPTDFLERASRIANLLSSLEHSGLCTPEYIESDRLVIGYELEQKIKAMLAASERDEGAFHNTVRDAYRMVNAARAGKVLPIEYLQNIEYDLWGAAEKQSKPKDPKEKLKLYLDIRYERVQVATTIGELELMRKDYQELCTLPEYSPRFMHLNANTIDMIDDKMWELRKSKRSNDTITQ